MANLTQLFHFDQLSVVLSTLVIFVAISVGVFARHYLKGDSHQGLFYGRLVAITCSVLILVSANHLVLFALALLASNVLLVNLMVHKTVWPAAKASGHLALKNFGFGFLCLCIYFSGLYASTGQLSHRGLMYADVQISAWLFLPLALAALAQSAIWPFHKWLLSSLNSPTPVSALMHAGLINGGGFLLARFMPLHAESYSAFLILFLVGLATVVFGNLWKLIQSDVKRMLACSTLGQMGFMVVQCGLGLFPAAIAHLCWHGVFKAYLFLSSGSAAQFNRLDLGYPPRTQRLVISMVVGILGAVVFAYCGDKLTGDLDGNVFLIGVAWIAGSQVALTLMDGAIIKGLIRATVANSLLGALYGLSVGFIENILAPLDLMSVQPLSWVHLVGFGFMVMGWFMVLYRKPLQKVMANTLWGNGFYVWALNASSPHPDTITAHRNHYRYA